MSCYLSNRAENIFVLSSLVSMRVMARNYIVLKIRGKMRMILNISNVFSNIFYSKKKYIELFHVYTDVTEI
jgi:hypothetical protein